MSRTYTYKNRKKQDCGKGHLNCPLCGFDKSYDNEKKTQKKEFMRFDILPFATWILKNHLYFLF